MIKSLPPVVITDQSENVAGKICRLVLRADEMFGFEGRSQTPRLSRESGGLRETLPYVGKFVIGGLILVARKRVAGESPRHGDTVADAEQEHLAGASRSLNWAAHGRGPAVLRRP